MGRAPCCEKVGLKRGKWTAEEDEKLINYKKARGDHYLRMQSCRLRWINYLREDVKRGNFIVEEEEAIVKLHKNLGNRWSLITSHLPGRTDNEIKNFWNSHLSRRIYLFRSISGAADIIKMARKKPTGRFGWASNNCKNQDQIHALAPVPTSSRMGPGLTESSSLSSCDLSLHNDARGGWSNEFMPSSPNDVDAFTGPWVEEDAGALMNFEVMWQCGNIRIHDDDVRDKGFILANNNNNNNDQMGFWSTGSENGNLYPYSFVL